MVNQQVFTNRTLNLRKIRYIGFDMDHTLVRYDSHHFEELAHKVAIERLIKDQGYPKELSGLVFEPDRVIRGLVLDTKNGNLLKLNQFSGIRISFHGTKKIEYGEQKRLYKSTYIDPGHPDYVAIDTSFSVATALLFAQLVDFKDGKLSNKLPSYQQLAQDVLTCVDECHRDGSLKGMVKDNIARYILKDPAIVSGLERLKLHGKKLFVLTNSYFEYTKLLLDYTINPYLTKHENWLELFDIVITGSQKPRFFQDDLPFLRIDPETGFMTNEDRDFTSGVFQGGNAQSFTESLGISGEDILYLGDHIYGDVVRLKKDCNWRTGLVIEELEDEVNKLKEAAPIDAQIVDLMKKKEPLEQEALKIITEQKETGGEIDDARFEELQNQISEIDTEISSLIVKHQNMFNPYWGEVMRIGNEESYFAGLVARYACIYMPLLSDFLKVSPRSYLRGARRTLPHEMWSVGP